MGITFTNDQSKGFEIFDAGKSLFLTGDSGTGKTALVKAMIEKAQSEGRGIAVTASTGLAASLLPGGRTIHSLLQTYPCMDLYNADFKEKAKNLEDIDLLIIDEISMIGKRFIPYLYNCLQAKEGKVQLVVVGDFFQLPPVKDDYAFKSPYWNYLDLEPCVLHEVVRQKDEKLICNLNRLKYGDAGCIPYFMSNSSPVPFQEQITICARAENARRINDMQLERLDGNAYTFTAQSEEGAFESEIPAEERLILKEGARVMATVNSKEYQNGSLGTVIDMNCDSVDVLFDSGREVRVFRRMFESGRVNKEGRKLSVCQFPLRLAYAITIHKSQGQTFSHVNIDGSSCWAPGQLYVAISRAVAAEHIHFSSPISAKNIKTDYSVLQFYRNLENSSFLTGSNTAAGY